jgi:hypothetical protein
MELSRIIPFSIGILGVATMVLAYTDPCGTVVNNYTECNTLRCKRDGLACCTSFILTPNQSAFCTNAANDLPVHCPNCP